MSFGDEPVDQRFIFRAEAIGQRAEVIVPLLLRARAGDHGLDKTVVEEPGDGELPGGSSTRLRMRADLLRELERLRAPFLLHHAPVVARGARARAGRGVGLVFAGENAARQRTVGHDAEPVELAGRQVLDLDLAIERIVMRLADHRTVDAETVADVADLGHAPSAEI